MSPPGHASGSGLNGHQMEMHDPDADTESLVAPSSGPGASKPVNPWRQCCIQYKTSIIYSVSGFTWLLALILINSLENKNYETDRAYPFGKALAVRSGMFHSCAILPHGHVKCWGWLSGFSSVPPKSADVIGDMPGEMGAELKLVDLGTKRNAKALSAGNGFTCAVLDNASIKCWGSNGYGALGTGDFRDHDYRSNIDMGEHLLPADLGRGRTAQAVSAGAQHTCALLDHGDVKCWGDNSYRQCGDDRLQTWKSNLIGMGDKLPAVDLGPGRTALSISSGAWHTCALLDTKQIKCWGYNETGAVGPAQAAGGVGPRDRVPYVDMGMDYSAEAVFAGYLQTCAFLADRKLVCWGAAPGSNNTSSSSNSTANLGLRFINFAERQNATAVALGYDHSCALLDNGSVACWGDNSMGQLGQNMTGSWRLPGADSPVPVDLGPGRVATAVTAGRVHTCALLDDATVKCWGGSAYGQLGLGSTKNRGDGPEQMGEKLPPVLLI